MARGRTSKRAARRARGKAAEAARLERAWSDSPPRSTGLATTQQAPARRPPVAPRVRVLLDARDLSRRSVPLPIARPTVAPSLRNIDAPTQPPAHFPLAKSRLDRSWQTARMAVAIALPLVLLASVLRDRLPSPAPHAPVEPSIVIALPAPIAQAEPPRLAVTEPVPPDTHLRAAPIHRAAGADMAWSPHRIAEPIPPDAHLRRDLYVRRPTIVLAPPPDQHLLPDKIPSRVAIAIPEPPDSALPAGGIQRFSVAPIVTAETHGSDDHGYPPNFFGRLVTAALARIHETVEYDHRYRTIAYPMGDVPSHTGVCSDVIVRAYRGVGIDLQQRVHLARLGTGDTSIDHRRVQVLRRYFERFGESLPISEYPEDYKPGAVVVYDVPWGRTSKFHIALVTDRLSASGRPLIVHNRGYGTKLEDALFHKRIIGHFRYFSTEESSATAPPPQRKPGRRSAALLISNRGAN